MARIPDFAGPVESPLLSMDRKEERIGVDEERSEIIRGNAPLSISDNIDLPFPPVNYRNP
jgi:hypothetical protein